MKKMVTEKDIGRMIQVIYENSEVGTTTGILLSCTQRIGILHAIEDFNPNGIEIFALKKVKKILKGKRENIYYKIYKNSDYYQEPPTFIKSGNFQKIFKEIRALGYWVIVESTLDDEYYFDIGPIKRVTKDYVSIRYFNALGQWDDSNDVIYFDEIIRVSFDDRYITQWRKYLEAK